MSCFGPKSLFSLRLIPGKNRHFHSSTLRPAAELIDGKLIAKKCLDDLKIKIEKFVGEGNPVPQLTALLVGSNPASESYVKIKLKAAKKVGIDTNTLRFSSIDEENLIREIRKLNEDPNVDGILVQLPLPSHIRERRICNSVTPEKDVDGFNVSNIGRLCLNQGTLIPCTAKAVNHIIKEIGISTLGKSALVCGRSKNVGLPISLLLHSQEGGSGGGMEATTVICHRNTPREELEKFCKLSDIVISAAGVPNLIRGHMVKEGACVIDVGMTRLVDKETNKPFFVGDVNFKEVSQIAGYITPVPGGVGPVTVAMLLHNTYKASLLRRESEVLDKISRKVL